MPLCSSRRKNNKRSRHSSSNKATHCLRNPIIVFILTFSVLGLLRFRVPARSRQAAAHLIQKRRAWKKLRSMSGSITYKLVEDGTATATEGALTASFQKYRAQNSQNGEAISVQQWVSLVAATIPPITTPGNADDSAVSVPSKASSSTKTAVIDRLNEVIASCPFQGVFFETPPVTASTFATQAFEFVLVDAPKLHIAASARPDPNAFANQFHSDRGQRPAAAAGAGVAVFSNLGGDATLISPQPVGTDMTVFAHLANFARGARDTDQRRDIWRVAAEAYRKKVLDTDRNSDVMPSDAAVWFSTSGMGIYWLHLRLDDRPKYYTYQPYKSLGHRKENA
jgi:hypothetical protein